MKFLSLFSGIGGLEYGLRDWAECVGISEIKESSVQIYRKNNGNVYNFGDITKIVPEKLPDFDMLVGGFPCQTFSMAGMREGFTQRKGRMIFYIYDILVAKKPKYFVLENMKGILSHNSGQTFTDILKLLGHAGYHVRVLCLNALNYGSAQNRERIIFLGSLEPFEKKIPEIKDNTKLFRDIREANGQFKPIKETDRNSRRLEQKENFSFELIGGYDRVGTLTTQFGCGEKAVWEKDSYRFLTPLECERLQGFPDGWTDCVSANNRYWALGNAVNARMSEYLFKEYLKGLWY